MSLIQGEDWSDTHDRDYDRLTGSEWTRAIRGQLRVRARILLLKLIRLHDGLQKPGRKPLQQDIDIGHHAVAANLAREIFHREEFNFFVERHDFVVNFGLLIAWAFPPASGCAYPEQGCVRLRFWIQLQWCGWFQEQPCY